MQIFIAALALFTASGAAAQDDYFDSGWPILLAQFVCFDNEICMTKLANCGPGADTCAEGVSICSITSDGEPENTFECQTDRLRSAAGLVVMIPRYYAETETHAFSAGQDTLYFAAQGHNTINGHSAERVAPNCLRLDSTGVTVCASEMASKAEADRWWRDFNN